MSGCRLGVLVGVACEHSWWVGLAGIAGGCGFWAWLVSTLCQSLHASLSVPPFPVAGGNPPNREPSEGSMECSQC